MWKIAIISVFASFFLGIPSGQGADKVIIGTLSSFKRPEKLGEVFKDNDTDSFDDIEGHIRQGSQLFSKKYCPNEVEIRDYDTAGTIEGAVKAIKQAEKDGAKLLIGFVSSGPILATNKLYPSRRIPIVTLMASHIDVAQKIPPTLQLSYNDELQGATLAKIVRHLSAKESRKILLLTDVTNPYSVSLSKETKLNLKGSNLSLHEYEYATPLAWAPSNWKLDDFRDASALIMTGEGREVLEVVSHLSKINTNYILIGGDGWYRGNVTQYLPTAGIYIPDTITVGHWTPNLSDQLSQEFGKAYKQAFKHDAGGTSGLAHDAIKTACEVWKRTKQFSFESFQGPSFEGLTGTIHFDQVGRQDTKKPLIYWFSKGKYRYERF